jgi:hypothetical protein
MASAKFAEEHITYRSDEVALEEPFENLNRVILTQEPHEERPVRFIPRVEVRVLPSAKLNTLPIAESACTCAT